VISDACIQIEAVAVHAFTLACVIPGPKSGSGYSNVQTGDGDMARKGKATEKIIAAPREAEVRIAREETVGKICRGFGISE
jgi:hypothetical protein